MTLQFGGVGALTDVSLVVPEGEIVSITGTNGAGETSMLNSGAFEAGELLHPDAVRVHLTPHPGGSWLPECATRAGAAAFARSGVQPGDHAQVAFGYHRFAGG